MGFLFALYTSLFFVHLTFFFLNPSVIQSVILATFEFNRTHSISNDHDGQLNVCKCVSVYVVSVWLDLFSGQTIASRKKNI